MDATHCNEEPNWLQWCMNVSVQRDGDPLHAFAKLAKRNINNKFFFKLNFCAAKKYVCSSAPPPPLLSTDLFAVHQLLRPFPPSPFDQHYIKP